MQNNHPRNRLGEPALVMDAEVWNEWSNQLGLDGDAAMAEHVGVNATTIWRLRTRKQKPGNALLARIRMLAGEELFPLLFPLYIPRHFTRDEEAA